MNGINFGICMLSLIPVRKESKEQSEQVTQILCGETFEIMDYGDRWSYIRIISDDYVGWINTKMITPISNESFYSIIQKSNCVIRNAIYQTDKAFNNFIHWIPAGSIFNADKEHLFLNDQKVAPLSGVEFYYPGAERDLVTDALRFLHSPYLWGGKSAMGIDCSGLSQVVCKMNGISLPRDAGQQANCGESVVSLQDALPGDLAFFVREDGKINHTGILLNAETIIHSSGMVRIDEINDQGIIRREDKVCTHQLGFLRRV